MLEKLDALGLGPARLLGGLVAVVAVGLAGWWLLRPPPAPIEDQIPMATETTGATGPGSAPPAVAAGTASTTTGPTEVVVHVAGAVARPGVQRLPADARIADAVDAGGGLAPDADLDRLNLAAPLTDGMRVYVPRRGEPTPPPVVAGDPAPVDAGATGEGGDAGGEGDDAPVNVNTAGLDELDALPGVGPATAQAIVDHREAHGPFTSVDQLLDVRGIGDAKLADLRDRVVL